MSDLEALVETQASGWESRLEAGRDFKRSCEMGHRKDRHRTFRHSLKLYRKRLYRQFTQAPIIDRLILLIGATSLVWYVIIYRPEQESESDPQLIAEPSSYIRSAVAEMNALQKIHNEHLYGPLRENDLVIVIQVHNRWSYLAGLISSLESVLHINRTLLIFSHDVYDEEGFVETLPKNVTFAKMMQIFYPNSIQLEPNRFPGDHPDDCPRNLPQHLAEEVGCQNSRYPDIHGHYREGKFCQTKHHWWWKINRIMDGLNVTMSHRGPFMFLEEDHYVVPDLIHMLRGLETVQPTFCPTCRMFVMGTYVKANLFSTLSAGITRSRWVSSKHNMGMVIYRDLWRSIRDNCSQDFCTYDDYNWDFSLYKATLTCLGEPLEAMVLRATRVYHVGECGVHHKGRNCDKFRLTNLAEEHMKAGVEFLFPSSLKEARISSGVMKRLKPNGGWSDIRDHYLCLHFVNDTL